MSAGTYFVLYGFAGQQRPLPHVPRVGIARPRFIETGRNGQSRRLTNNKVNARYNGKVNPVTAANKRGGRFHVDTFPNA